MSGFAERIRPHVRSELAAAQRAEQRGELRLAFSHLERAHVLSQGSTVEHVRVHGRMLAWAARHRDLRELVGQLLRVVVAATKTFAGWVPHGNTGGANVGALLTMPIAADLAAIIKRARETS
jgi:uncharacterized protein DUF3703